MFPVAGRMFNALRAQKRLVPLDKQLNQDEIKVTEN